MQSLTSHREELKGSIIQAQKREMEATKKLATISKSRPASQRRVAAPPSSKPLRNFSKPITDGDRQRSGGRPPSQADDWHQCGVALRKRPRSASSKIPLPRALSDEYRRKLESGAERVVAAQLA